LNHATATTEIYSLSLHDALPIWGRVCRRDDEGNQRGASKCVDSTVRATPLPVLQHVIVRPRANLFSKREGDLRSTGDGIVSRGRSEEHTSELQSRENLVCRLLLE